MENKKKVIMKANYKLRFTFCLLFIWPLVHADFASAATPEAAARGVIRRLLPEQAESFVTESIPKEGSFDVFELETIDGRVHLRGSNGLAICSAFNWYLRYYARGHVSWRSDQLDLPDPLPAVESKVRRVSPWKYRYCFNYCAFSYTLAWWDWPQWERMIDWMALHGINMPLAVTGQEATWLAVYRKLGLTDEQIKDFIVGPAYLPFGWMGCVDGLAGPLPQDWIERHQKLQQKILARQRELGMTPVLQGFTGHVPEAVKEIFPDARVFQLPKWLGFDGTWCVDPLDPLFERIGKAFIEEQMRQFGTDHLYASDTFIEMTPPSSDPNFLARMGKAIYGAMRTGDPEAVWVLQSWPFSFKANFWQLPQVKALLDAVPDEHMVVLDMNGRWSATQAYYGKPWIAGVIHNFGARVGLWGRLPMISDDTLKSPKRGKLSGIGMVMEGFGYNEILYDQLSELTWRSQNPQIAPWSRDYVHSRYGRLPPAAQEAWDLLRQTVYASPRSVWGISFVCRRPGLATASGPRYDQAKLVLAWEKLLACADELGRLETYRFDLVNVGRQVLNDLTERYHNAVVTAYQAKDSRALDRASQRFMELISDMDELLATRKEFLLGRWLADAKRWARTDQQRRLYEVNARDLITRWGGHITDYSQRQWSGMLTGFYQPRWAKFLDRLQSSLTGGEPFSAAQLRKEFEVWEEKWTRQRESYPAEPAGDSIAVARRLLDKYRQEYQPEALSLTTGKPTICSAALPGYPTHLANDGRRRDTNRYWATDITQDKAAWWQVDLEKPTTIARIVVVFYYGDKRHYGFTVETSTDAKTWQIAADRRDNTELSTPAGVTVRFTPRPARYIRITLTSNSANTGRHLVEVMAYDK